MCVCVCLRKRDVCVSEEMRRVCVAVFEQMCRTLLLILNNQVNSQMEQMLCMFVHVFK